MLRINENIPIILINKKNNKNYPAWNRIWEFLKHKYIDDIIIINYDSKIVGKCEKYKNHLFFNLRRFFMIFYTLLI